jgi:predicted transcriptional regulator
MKMRNRSNMQFPTLPSELHFAADISGNKFCRRFPTSPSAINDHEGVLSKSRWRLSHVYFGKRKRKKRKKTGIYFASEFISFASFLPVQRHPQSVFELVAQQSVSLFFA